MADDRVALSVIVPTTGRRSLKATLDSIVEQLEPGDELLVRCSRDADYGSAARQSLTERACGTHLVFIDDDDQFARGAFDVIRRFARENPDRIGMFRMRYLDGRLLWTEPVFRRRNVSTQMFCVPNIPDKLGKWPVDRPRTKGMDWAFISETVELQGEPIFREEVISHNRSDRRPLVRLLKRVARPFEAVKRRILGSRRDW